MNTFIGLPTYSYVTRNGGTFINYVKGFDNVAAIPLDVKRSRNLDRSAGVGPQQALPFAGSTGGSRSYMDNKQIDG